MLCLIAVSTFLSAATCEDVSPNQPNAPRTTRASSAGLTLAVAGDRDTLYAVSLNAGVWRSDKGGPWHQLPNSPPCANCIALDPANVRHVAVGERNGLATNIRLNHCGVWESVDAGEHWRFLFDPRTLSGSDTQAIPALAFDHRSSLFVAAPTGIGVKRAGQIVFSFQGSPGVGRITALSVDGQGVWARSANKLLRTTNEGVSWEVIDIPKTFGADTVNFSSRGDLYSLGGAEAVAFMTCVLDPGVGGNRNSLIAYDTASKRWFTQSLASGNGTGLGGRRFAKFDAGNLLYGGGQEIHQAPVSSYNSVDGQIRFDSPVQTNWGGPYGTPPHEVHSDTWDMHLDPLFGTGNRDAWIACDGGVFAASPDLIDPAAGPDRLFNRKWLPHNDGLHTHHIHT
ncbi:MAG: WD40/YVTN/BNR-like repeat-containing protein, partial [Fimbriimonadales bacterium]